MQRQLKITTPSDRRQPFVNIGSTIEESIERSPKLRQTKSFENYLNNLPVYKNPNVPKYTGNLPLNIRSKSVFEADKEKEAYDRLIKMKVETDLSGIRLKKPRMETSRASVNNTIQSSLSLYGGSSRKQKNQTQKSYDRLIMKQSQVKLDNYDKEMKTE